MQLIDLKLVTPDLAVQAEFYSRVFHFPILSAAADEIEFQAGSSRLTFQQSPLPVKGPYHFAFNIPENQFDKAAQWIRQQVALIPDESGQDTFYSESWEAHMLYFYDPAGNILELIARHSLPSASHSPFSGLSLLGISEIGIAVDDVPAKAAAIASRAQTTVYRESISDTFAAVGDEQGLFIVVKIGRIWFPNTGKAAGPLPLTVLTQSSAGRLTWQFPEGGEESTTDKH
jgi:catechol 2,3-dioxygenase-like lactoylglutathione lyase family enzyme